MQNNRVPILFALLLLLFFVSTSAGLADISSVQEQLRLIQLKVIGEKLKILQQRVLKLNAGSAPPAPVVTAPAPPVAPTRENLSRTLEQQIQTLEGVVATLKPRAIEEETARIENRIATISMQLKTASGDALLALQAELQNLIVQHASLEVEVKHQLEDALKYKIAVVIGQEIRALQEKIATLPRPATYRAPKPATPPAPDAAGIQSMIEKLQLKLLQAQVRAIQEKVGQVAH